MRKKPTFAGVLAKPMKHRLDALWRTPACFRGPPAEWKRRVKEALLADLIDFSTCWLQLLRHHGVDLAEWDGPSALELAMARQYVPAFQEPPRRGAPPKLGPADTIRLVVACDAYERRAYAASGHRPPRRKIAREVAKQPWAQEIGLSDDTIRDLLPELTKAFAAFQAGNPTAFQDQFYNVVVPLVFGSFAGAPTPADEAE